MSDLSLLIEVVFPSILRSRVRYSARRCNNNNHHHNKIEEQKKRGEMPRCNISCCFLLSRRRERAHRVAATAYCGDWDRGRQLLPPAPPSLLALLFDKAKQLSTNVERSLRVTAPRCPRSHASIFNYNSLCFFLALLFVCLTNGGDGEDVAVGKLTFTCRWFFFSLRAWLLVPFSFLCVCVRSFVLCTRFFLSTKLFFVVVVKFCRFSWYNTLAMKVFISSFNATEFIDFVAVQRCGVSALIVPPLPLQRRYVVWWNTASVLTLIKATAESAISCVSKAMRSCWCCWRSHRLALCSFFLFIFFFLCSKKVSFDIKMQTWCSST